MSTEKQSMLERILLPVIISAVLSGFTGYMGASKAIAVLEERMDTIELAQKSFEEDQEALETQVGDLRVGQVVIETKVDMLLAKTSP